MNPRPYKDPASKRAFALAEAGRSQRAEDHYAAVRGECTAVDDVIVTEGDAVKRSLKRACTCG